MAPRPDRDASSRRRPSRLRFRRRTLPGAAPGDFAVSPESPPTRIQLLRYDAERCEVFRHVQPNQLSSLILPDKRHWIHVVGLGDEPTLKALAQQFHLHPLALEDVVHMHQHPKVESYARSLFVVLRMPLPGPRFDSEQISLFLGTNWVLTFDDTEGDCWEGLRKRLVTGGNRLCESGSDYLAYCLIDAVIDSYFPVFERLTDALDEIEETLQARNANQLVRQVFDLRNELLIVRRNVRPHREAINSLLRNDQPLISDETRLYFRDCYDHCTQQIELSEVQREICTDVRDFALSLISQRLNEVMKVLTIIATIFMPLSYLAGLYGMNFDTSSPWNMPELKARFGYPLTLLAMASIAGGMLVFFQRKGWLNSPRL